MKSISFDNPYWLIMAIPLALALIIPFIISLSKDNKSRGYITSLILHSVIIAAVTLAAAGLTYTAVMTRTKIYVVADVSDSSRNNLDEIDRYIAEIADNLPQNSKLGIVCFGKDQVILTSSGKEIKSVKDAVVDGSGTDIAAALDFTSYIFSEGELKRIILITDGLATENEGGIISAVERLAAKDIKLDTVYIDANLKAGDKEAQISEVEASGSTYLGFETEAKVLVELNTDADVILELYSRLEGAEEYEKIKTEATVADAGMNLIKFRLPTDEEGVFEYKITLATSEDSIEQNNEFFFTQRVCGKRKVLLVSGDDNDLYQINQLYRNDADITLVKVNQYNHTVPFTLDDLSQYDEFILSNVDIREISNVGAFIDSIDTLVSRFGKSLITFGDLYMQNKDHEAFTKLEELLPVSYGNANKDEKLYTILLDVSRSMNDTYQLAIAKDAAIKLISILEDKDSVIYVPFAGKVLVEEGWKPMKLGDIVDFVQTEQPMTYRQWLYNEIQSAMPYQGTLIGAALEQAYSNIKGLDFGESQIMIISDGLSFSHENEDAVELARTMHEMDNITVSAISIISTAGDNMLPSIATAGGGTHYDVARAEDLADLVFATIADDFNESTVRTESKVNIVTYRDDTLKGIIELPPVRGYMNTKAKADATLVLSVDYNKNDTVTVEVPLYSYRQHGNGRVSTFTSSLSGNWLSRWSDDTKEIFFGNILRTNTPDERIDYSYLVNVNANGTTAEIDIQPSFINPKAGAYLELITPSGEAIRRELAFDKNRYYTIVDTEMLGRYTVNIYYPYYTVDSIDDLTPNSVTYFDLSYKNEYNAFAAFDIGNIYAFMRNGGSVYTDGDVDLSINRNEVATYEYSFAIPLLILSVALFVIDIFIRKTRWKEIKAFFEKLSRKRRKEQ